MKHESHFLITPRPELVTRLGSMTGSPLEDLGEPVIWSGNEGGRGGFSPEEMETFVKVLFLDALRRERGDSEEFEHVLPALQTTRDFFDSLWSLRRVEIDMTVEVAIADAAATGTLDKIAPTGSERVDEWLKVLRKRYP